MPQTVYSHGDDTDFPDDANWIPGELGEPSGLHAALGLNVRLERARVYPNGVVVTLTVRAVVPRSHDAQRSFGADVIGFHQNAHTGPRLEQWDSTHDAWTPTEPWCHEGTGGHYTLAFWVASHGGDPQPLVLRFSWPARFLSSEILYLPDDLDDARSRAQQLFD